MAGKAQLISPIVVIAIIALPVAHGIAPRGVGLIDGTA
jgi:hypothetical protein